MSSTNKKFHVRLINMLNSINEILNEREAKYQLGLRRSI